MSTPKYLPGTGRGTMRSMVEGSPHPRRILPLDPSTTPLRVAVPLPVPGRS
jgi:hypothetical protein